MPEIAEMQKSSLKLGTESCADIRHLTFSNCTIRNTRTGIAIYMKDGGTIEAVTFANITIETKPSGRGSHTGGRRPSAEWPIFMDLERRGPDSKTGTIRDVVLRDLVIFTGGRSVIQGLRSHPIEGLTLDNVTVNVRGFEDLDRISKPRGSSRTAWEDPEGGTHASAPAHLIFANVRGLQLRNVRIAVQAEGELQERSAVFADHVEDMVVEGFRGRQSVPDSDLPVLNLRDCRGVHIDGCRAPAGTGTLLQVEGAETVDVSVTNSDLRTAREVVRFADDANEDVVYQTGNRV